MFVKSSVVLLVKERFVNVFTPLITCVVGVVDVKLTFAYVKPPPANVGDAPLKTIVDDAPLKVKLVTVVKFIAVVTDVAVIVEVPSVIDLVRLPEPENV